MDETSITYFKEMTIYPLVILEDRFLGIFDVLRVRRHIETDVSDHVRAVVVTRLDNEAQQLALDLVLQNKITLIIQPI